MATEAWTVDEWKEYWQKRCVAAENRILELEVQIEQQDGGRTRPR